MTVVHNTLYFILALIILVFVHELGHFLAARLVGVNVLRFSIGFGWPIFSYKGKKGTEYVLSILPLGGYVKMLDEDEGPVPDLQKPYAFNQKSVWSRALIVIAGPLFNFIFAVIALSGMLMIGVRTYAPIIGEVQPYSIAQKVGIQPYDKVVKVEQEEIPSWGIFQQNLLLHLTEDKTIKLTLLNVKTGKRHDVLLPPFANNVDELEGDFFQALGIKPYIPNFKSVVGKVEPKSAASQAGLMRGDVILALNGKSILYWSEVVAFMKDNGTKSVRVLLLRDKEQLSVMVHPQLKQVGNETFGQLGIAVEKQFVVDDWSYINKYKFAKALVIAFKQTQQMINISLNMFWKMIRAEISVKNIGGPIGIAQGAGESASIGIAYYLYFLALISVSLGVINLMPLPVLDGGHLLFLAIEFMIGRPLSRNIRDKANVFGVILILALTFVAMFNDITRLL